MKHLGTSSVMDHEAFMALAIRLEAQRVAWLAEVAGEETALAWDDPMEWLLDAVTDEEYDSMSDAQYRFLQALICETRGQGGVK